YLPTRRSPDLYDWTAPSGGLLLFDLGFDHAHHVALLHDQQFLTVDLDLGAGPFAEQHAVAGLDVERHDLTLFVARAGTHGDHLALHGLFLGCVGNDDAAPSFLLGLDAAYDDAIMQRSKLHVFLQWTNKMLKLPPSEPDDQSGTWCRTSSSVRRQTIWFFRFSFSRETGKKISTHLRVLLTH